MIWHNATKIGVIAINNTILISPHHLTAKPTTTNPTHYYSHTSVTTNHQTAFTNLYTRSGIIRKPYQWYEFCPGMTEVSHAAATLSRPISYNLPLCRSHRTTLTAIMSTLQSQSITWAEGLSQSIYYLCFVFSIQGESGRTPHQFHTHKCCVQHLADAFVLVSVFSIASLIRMFVLRLWLLIITEFYIVTSFNTWIMPHI